MKAMFIKHQYGAFEMFFVAVTLLLGFGPLVGQDDIIKLFVGAGLASAYVAGTCRGPLSMGRPTNQPPRPYQPKVIRVITGEAELLDDQGESERPDEAANDAGNLSLRMWGEL